MNNRMLESVKKAGFYVDDEGKIWAPRRHAPHKRDHCIDQDS